MEFDLESALDDNTVQKFLKTVQKRFGDVSKGNRVVANMIYPRVFRDVIQHFKDEKGPDGQWTAWSDAYAEHMARIGKSGNRLLQDTGRLRNAFEVGTHQPADGFLFVNKAKTDAGFPYAQAHDEGGPKLPKRQYMWVSMEALEDVGSMVLNWIVGDENES